MSKGTRCHNTKTIKPYIQKLLTTIPVNTMPLKPHDDILCAIKSFNHAVQEIA